MAFYRSLGRALDMLEVLYTEAEAGRGEVTLMHLASRVGVDKGTASRILTDLKDAGIVENGTAGHKLRLGITLLRYGTSVLKRLDIRTIAHPVLVELASSSTETVHLGIVREGRVVYLDKIEAPDSLQMRSRVGDSMPLTTTGIGKAMLAFLPTEQLEATVAGGLPRPTAGSITDPSALRGEMQAIRQRGFAYDREENELGIRCVAAPVFDHDHHVVAGISVAGPAFRMPDARLEQLAPLVLAAAQGISGQIGDAVGLPSGPDEQDSRAP